MPDRNYEDVELRCSGGLHGIVRNGLMEVKCRHWACTRGNNVTYHLFDPVTGKIVDTHRYQEPNKETK